MADTSQPLWARGRETLTGRWWQYRFRRQNCGVAYRLGPMLLLYFKSIITPLTRACTRGNKADLDSEYFEVSISVVKMSAPNLATDWKINGFTLSPKIGEEDGLDAAGQRECCVAETRSGQEAGQPGKMMQMSKGRLVLRYGYSAPWIFLENNIVSLAIH